MSTETEKSDKFINDAATFLCKFINDAATFLCKFINDAATFLCKLRGIDPTQRVRKPGEVPNPYDFTIAKTMVEREMRRNMLQIMQAYEHAEEIEERDSRLGECVTNCEFVAGKARMEGTPRTFTPGMKVIVTDMIGTDLHFHVPGDDDSGTPASPTYTTNRWNINEPSVTYVERPENEC